MAELCIKHVSVKKFLVILFVILLAALLGYILYAYFYEKEHVNYILEINKETRQKSDSLLLSNDSLTAKQKALLYTESSQEEVVFNYYIITGSFSNEKNAERHLNTLKEKGYDPKIVRSDFEHYKVSVFSSYDKTEAMDSLEKLKGQEEFNSAWLLKRRK